MKIEEKFPFKKIMQFLINQESSFKTLRAFFENTDKGESKSRETVETFLKNMQEVAGKSNSKEIARLIQNFSIHKMELGQTESNMKLINEKLNYWIDEVSEKYKKIMEKVREKERMKDKLSELDIQAYKKELTEDMIAVTKSRDSLISLYCFGMIKNCSQQLQALTNSLQNHKQQMHGE